MIFLINHSFLCLYTCLGNKYLKTYFVHENIVTSTRRFIQYYYLLEYIQTPNILISRKMHISIYTLVSKDTLSFISLQKIYVIGMVNIDWDIEEVPRI